MKLIAIVAHNMRNRRRYRAFSEMPSPLLAFFAVSSGLVTFGLGAIVARAAPWYLTAVEEAGWVNFDAMFWGGCILGVATCAWLAAAVFARCERLLRDRWFQ